MIEKRKIYKENFVIASPYESENLIIVTGIVSAGQEFSHEVHGEKFYKSVIEVKRLSDTSDLLPITFSEMQCNINCLPVGTAIEIIGQIRSYNCYTEQRRRLVLTVYANKFTVLGEKYKQDNQLVELSGYICKTPVIRKTPLGREIADILIAVHRGYKKSDYIPLIAWGRNARFMSKYDKGDKIHLYGRMQSRKYQKISEDGTVTEKTALEVSIQRVDKCIEVQHV